MTKSTELLDSDQTVEFKSVDDKLTTENSKSIPLTKKLILKLGDALKMSEVVVDGGLGGGFVYEKLVTGVELDLKSVEEELK